MSLGIKQLKSPPGTCSFCGAKDSLEIVGLAKTVKEGTPRGSSKETPNEDRVVGLEILECSKCKYRIIYDIY